MSVIYAIRSLYREPIGSTSLVPTIDAIWKPQIPKFGIEYQILAFNKAHELMTYQVDQTGIVTILSYVKGTKR